MLLKGGYCDIQLVQGKQNIVSTAESVCQLKQRNSSCWAAQKHQGIGVWIRECDGFVFWPE